MTTPINAGSRIAGELLVRISGNADEAAQTAVTAGASKIVVHVPKGTEATIEFSNGATFDRMEQAARRSLQGRVVDAPPVRAAARPRVLDVPSPARTAAAVTTDAATDASTRSQVAVSIAENVIKSSEKVAEEVGLLTPGKWSKTYMWDPGVLKNRATVGELVQWLEHLERMGDDVFKQLPARTKQELGPRLELAKSFAGEMSKEQGGTFKRDLREFSTFAQRVSREVKAILDGPEPAPSAMRARAVNPPVRAVAASAAPALSTIDQALAEGVIRHSEQLNGAITPLKRGYWSQGYMWDPSVLNSRVAAGELVSFLGHLKSQGANAFERLPASTRSQVDDVLKTWDEVAGNLHKDEGGYFRDTFAGLDRFGQKISTELKAVLDAAEPV